MAARALPKKRQTSTVQTQKTAIPNANITIASANHHAGLYSMPRNGAMHNVTPIRAMSVEPRQAQKSFHFQHFSFSPLPSFHQPSNGFLRYSSSFVIALSAMVIFTLP